MNIKKISITSYYMILMIILIYQIFFAIYRFSKSMLISNTLAGLETKQDQLAQEEQMLQIQLSNQQSLSHLSNSISGYLNIKKPIIISSQQKIASEF